MNHTTEILKNIGVETERFIKILEMAPDDQGMEDEFIFVELTECHGNEVELADTVAYLSKEIWLEGEITVKETHFYLDAHKLMDSDEFEIDGTWCKSRVCIIRNEDYIDCLDYNQEWIGFGQELENNRM